MRVNSLEIIENIVYTISKHHIGVRYAGEKNRKSDA